jgi:Arc/MetJ family transcription regulator
VSDNSISPRRISDEPATIGIFGFRFLAYTMHMKRTNLVLDPHLLEEAIRVFGAKTYSAAVNAALKEVLRVRHIQSLPEFFGSGLWEGSLAEMREDRTQKQRPLKRRSHR